MIESIRKFAGSWAAIIILTLAGFALIVTDGFSFRFSEGGAVASVGGEDIGAREFRLALRRSELSGGVEAQLARAGLYQFALNGLIVERASEIELRALGFEAPDAAVIREIQADPGFQTASGAFSQEAYDRQLGFLALSRVEYEEDVRDAVGRIVLQGAVASGAQQPEPLAEALWLLSNERRALRYVRVDAAEGPEPEAPDEETLRAYVAENADRFTEPERRRLRVFWLRPEDRADVDAVSEDAARAEYEERIDDFVTLETRNVQQIVFEDAETAQEALDRIVDGAPFDQIASEQGLSAEDAAFGYLSFEALSPLNPEVAEAAFAAEDGDVVGPVETAAGFAVVRVFGVRPGSEVSFEMARPALALSIAVDAAARALPELANDIEDSRAAGDDLAAIAEAEGARIFEATIDAAGSAPAGEVAPDLPRDPAFLTRAFELEIGEEIDLVEGPQGDFYVIEVLEITPEAPQSFEDAREAALAAWISEARATAAAEAAEELEAGAVAARLAGEDPAAALENIAAERGLEMRDAGPLTRGETADGLSAEILAEAFAAPAADALGTVVSAPVEDGAARIVAVVSEVLVADPSTDAAREEIAGLRSEAAQSMAQELLLIYQNELIQRLGATTNPAAIEQALSTP